MRSIIKFVSTITLVVLIGYGSTSCRAQWRNDSPQVNESDKALAAYSRELLTKVKSITHKVNIFTVASGDEESMLKVLAGETPPKAGELRLARQQIGELVATLEQGTTWPAAPTFEVAFTKLPPVIDGKLHDAVWDHAASLDKIYPSGREPSATPATAWKFLWDANYLYACVACTDSNIIAPLLNRDDSLYRYDCIELFLLPDIKKGDYWEIEISPTGVLFDAFCQRNVAWNSIITTTASLNGIKYACNMAGTPNKPDDADTNYTVEMAIPWKALPGATKARAGSEYYFLPARMETTGRRAIPYAMFPWLHSFHNHVNYARLVLRK